MPKLYPTIPLQDLYHIPLHKQTQISEEQLIALEKHLQDDPINGHRKAYLDLYTWTGNPAFKDNLFISTRSGTVGGLAWNANQLILEKYPSEYPKHNNHPSIAKFSWLVGKENVELIRENFNKTGKAIVPDERTLRMNGDAGAWLKQDLSQDGKVGDLYRVSPPLHQANMDKYLTSDMSKPAQLAKMLIASYLSPGNNLANQEAQKIIEEAYIKVRRQEQTDGNNKNWLGLSIHEVCDNLKKSGHSFNIQKVKDLYVVIDENSVPYGAFTKDMILDTLNMRAYKEMDSNSSLSYNEAIDSYINKYKQANEEIINKLPELDKVFKFNNSKIGLSENDNSHWYSRAISQDKFHDLPAEKQAILLNIKSDQLYEQKLQQYNDTLTTSVASGINFGISDEKHEQAMQSTMAEQSKVKVV